MPADVPLPLHGESLDHSDRPEPWKVHQQPTTLIGFWPGESAPTQTEVLAGLQSFWGEGEFKQIDELEGALWNGVFQTPLSIAPMILWADPASPLRKEDIDDPAVHACRWVVGMETLLHPQIALEQYTLMLRALATLGCTAVLDPITQRFWERTILDDLTCPSPADLTFSDVFTIHAVSADANSTGAAWLHTHGLWRCGLPELEMLEVPRDRLNAASEFINETASYFVDADIPEPGSICEVGDDVQIVLQPWQAVVPQITENGAGGMEEREGHDNPHAGVRAVICDPTQRGMFRKHWVWPQHAVEAVQRRQVVFYRSTASSRRLAIRAQARWGDLATVFAAVARHPAVLNKTCFVLVKAGLQADDGDPEHLEHVWLEAQSFTGEHVEARLVSQPRAIKSLTPGMNVRIEKSQLTDWSVQTTLGMFGPGDVPAMWRSIHQLTGGVP